LQDHLSVGLTWRLKHPEKGLALGSPLLTDPSFFNGWPVDFIQFGQVPANELKTILQGSTTESTNRKILLRPEACHTETICLYAPLGVHMCGVDVAATGEYITTLTVCLTPTSRGSVTIASSDPADPPIIDVNFNATEADRYILREGLKKTVSVMRETESGQSFIQDEVVPKGHTAVQPGSANDTFDKRIRDFGVSLDHPCGSCAMGKVVDPECKVMGVQGLRVVDASIFPIPISAHPQACVYALAEKAAEMIAQSADDVCF
jgi:choline dehydrogenase-like flavoprotein